MLVFQDGTHNIGFLGNLPLKSCLPNDVNLFMLFSIYSKLITGLKHKVSRNYLRVTEGQCGQSPQNYILNNS